MISSKMPKNWKSRKSSFSDDLATLIDKYIKPFLDNSDDSQDEGTDDEETPDGEKEVEIWDDPQEKLPQKQNP
jgi:hypothetical protein